MSTPRRHVAIAALLVLTTLISGCITTSSAPPRRGIPIGPGPSGTSRSTPGNPNGAGEPIVMPDGPIANPVSKDATFASRVTVSLLEMGSVPSDGQVLPLVSPDGRFMAVESGEAPTWATLLATNDQRPALGTRVLVYSIDESANASKDTSTAQTPTLTPLAWSLAPNDAPANAAAPPVGLPTGVVLGRSCDSNCFLIESPRPDGSRWIGQVDWVSGKLTWLVQDDQVNAHAVIGPGGELAFSRRLVGSPPLSELVIRKPGGGGGGVVEGDVVMRTPAVSYCYPLFSDELDVVYAFALSATGVELFAYRIPAKGGDRELTVVGRRQILSTPDEAAVFQSVVALQVPPVYPGQSPAKLGGERGGGEGGGGTGTLLMFHPGAGRMCVFDRRSGTMSPLLERSSAAALVLNGGQAGYLLSTEKSLRYVEAETGSSANTSGNRAQASEGLNVVTGALLPRLTTDLQWPYVLVGPGGKPGEPRFRVMKLRFGEVR